MKILVFAVGLLLVVQSLADDTELCKLDARSITKCSGQTQAMVTALPTVKLTTNISAIDPWDSLKNALLALSDVQARVDQGTVGSGPLVDGNCQTVGDLQGDSAVVRLNPFIGGCVRATNKGTPVKFTLNRLSLPRVAWLAAGIALLIMAPRLVESDLAYYSAGFGIGSIVSLLLIFYIAYRNRREAAGIAVVAGGPSLIGSALDSMGFDGNAARSYSPLTWLAEEAIDTHGVADSVLPSELLSNGHLLWYQVLVLGFFLVTTMVVGTYIYMQGPPQANTRAALSTALQAAALLMIATSSADMVLGAVLIVFALAIRMTVFISSVVFWNVAVVFMWLGKCCPALACCGMCCGCCGQWFVSRPSLREARRHAREATRLHMHLLRSKLQTQLHALTPLLPGIVRERVTEFATNHDMPHAQTRLRKLAAKEAAEGTGDVRVDDEGRVIRADEIHSDGELDVLMYEDEALTEREYMTRRDRITWTAREDTNVQLLEGYQRRPTWQMPPSAMSHAASLGTPDPRTLYREGPFGLSTGRTRGDDSASDRRRDYFEERDEPRQVDEGAQDASESDSGDEGAAAVGPEPTPASVIVAYVLLLNPLGFAFSIHHFYIGSADRWFRLFTLNYLGFGLLADLLILPWLVSATNARALRRWRRASDQRDRRRQGSRRRSHVRRSLPFDRQHSEPPVMEPMPSNDSVADRDDDGVVDLRHRRRRSRSRSRSRGRREY